MERFRFRSTSLVDIQAELRQLDLLAEAERARRPNVQPARWQRMLAGLPIVGRRTSRRRDET